MEHSVSRISRPRRFVVLQCVVVLATVLVAIVGSPVPVLANKCDPYECSFWAQGNSGHGSYGTAIDVQIPNFTQLYTSSDGVAFNAFIINDVNYSSALEAGVLYGWFTYCNATNPYYFPYGTKDNGTTESADCGESLPAYGNYYWARAFQVSGRGYSSVENGSQQLIWQKDWGNYDTVVQFSLNNTNAEVHLYSSSYTYWDGTVNMFHGSWLDHNDHWNYWSFTNVSDDCPYNATWYSNDAWQASSSC